MKSEKEFIDSVYKKAEIALKEEQRKVNRKKKIWRTAGSLAACFIVFIGVWGLSDNGFLRVKSYDMAESTVYDLAAGDEAQSLDASANMESSEDAIESEGTMAENGEAVKGSSNEISEENENMSGSSTSESTDLWMIPYNEDIEDNEADLDPSKTLTVEEYHGGNGIATVNLESIETDEMVKWIYSENSGCIKYEDGMEKGKDDYCIFTIGSGYSKSGEEEVWFLESLALPEFN